MDEFCFLLIHNDMLITSSFFFHFFFTFMKATFHGQALIQTCSISIEKKQSLKIKINPKEVEIFFSKKNVD